MVLSSLRRQEAKRDPAFPMVENPCPLRTLSQGDCNLQVSPQEARVLCLSEVGGLNPRPGLRYICEWLCVHSCDKTPQPKATWGGKGSFQLSPYKSITKGNQGGNSKAGTWRKELRWRPYLVASSHGLLILLSYTI